MTRPVVTFQLETWARLRPEAETLWPAHYAELCQDKARMPMGPDLKWYEACEALGMLQVVVARSAGRVVGYQISLIRPHTHYSSVLCSFEDTFYLDPQYRKGLCGVKLISESLRLLAARGVQRAFFMSIESHPTDRIFQYLGFKRTHTTWSKWIGAAAPSEA